MDDTDRVEYEPMYDEGSWTYVQVLVDGEPAGFASINFSTKQVGLNLHHMDEIPGGEILEALARTLGPDFKVARKS